MTSSNGNIFRVTVIYAGNSPVPGEFPAQRPVTRCFDVFLGLNKRLSKQWWGWWLETPSNPLWRHRNGHNISIRHQSVQSILRSVTIHQLPLVDRRPLIPHDQYHDCWWHGDIRSQGIISHGIGLIPGNSGLSNNRVNEVIEYTRFAYVLVQPSACTFEAIVN